MAKIFCDAFYVSDTQGVPLAVQIAAAREKGGGISVPHFYTDAVRAGWKPEKALAVSREALIDSGCLPEYVEAACAYLESLATAPARRKK